MFIELCWSFYTEISSWLLKSLFQLLGAQELLKKSITKPNGVPLLGLVMFAQPPVLVLALQGQQTLPQLCLEDFCVHTVFLLRGSP